MQQEIADTVARLGGPGFVGHDDEATAVPQRLGQPLDLGRLARALATLEGDEHATVAQPPPSGRVVAQRGLDVVVERDLLAVVHLAIREQAGEQREHTAGGEHDAGAVDDVADAADVQRGLADLCHHERDGGEREDEDDADHRLQHGKDPSAHLVVDVGAEQGRPGEICDARAEAEPDDEDHGERDLRHHRTQDQ